MSKRNAWWDSRILCLGLTLASGLALLLGLLLAMGAAYTKVVLAQGATIRYVAPAPTGSDSGNDCTNSYIPCATIQHAVDVAAPGDEIRVARGDYTDVQSRSGITQVVYLSKTVTVRGGYTTTNWDTSYPLTQSTTLDAQGQGRVLYITGDITPTVDGLCLTGGNAAGLGGSPSRDAGGGVYAITATVTMSNCQVFSSTAGYGGGLCFRNSNGTLLIDNLIRGNRTTQGGRGGGLYFGNSAHVALTGNTISSNEAGPLLNGFGTGGGATFDNSPGATLRHNIVDDNRASWGGGMMFVDSPTATLIANTISNNKADHDGGGMKHYAGVGFDHCDNVTLMSNTIRGNSTANHCGGVCFSESDNAVLTGNAIVSNTRKSNYDGHSIGVYLHESKNISLVGNTISYNTSQDMDLPGTILGGGLYIGSNSTAALMFNEISSNGATRGGGLYIASHSIVTLTSNTITGNAVYSSCCQWCYDPVGCGGGLHVQNSIAALTNTVIAGNQAETAGGGLFVEGGDITLINSVVTDNQIAITGEFTGSGSGLYIVASSPRLLHTTIARNGGGDGSGIYITGTTSTATMSNTILVNQAVGITVSAGNRAILNGVLWYGNTANTGGEGAITITHEYTGHPAFVNGDYHLTAASAAIDKGVDAGVTADIDGDPRPLDGNCDGPAVTDIGADEFYPHPGLTVTKRASPDRVQAGEPLTYTLHVTNTGNVFLTATITDVLPNPVVPTGVQTWSPVILAPGDVWEETVVVTVEMDHSGPLTNVVRVTTVEGATGVYTETSMSDGDYCLYLPLVLKN